MKTPRPPSSYADIPPILDPALAAGGGRYRPDGTAAGAHRWRHRAYAFRRSLQHHQASEWGPTTTPYDGMVLTIDPTDTSVVLINAAKPLGQLTTLDGLPLTPGMAPTSIYEDPKATDPLIDQARQAAIDLGLGD